MPVPTGDLSRRSVLVAGLLGAAGALTACGGQSDGDSPPTRAQSAAAATVSTSPDGTQAITITVKDDYVFLPDRFTVKPGKVQLTLTSIAEQLTHNIRFTPDKSPAPITAEVPILAPGDSQTIEFDVSTTGDYQYECSFHVQLGQIGTMTVTAA